MNGRIVLELQEFKEKFHMSESEVLYKAMRGELHACFFSPLLWVGYRVDIGAITINSNERKIWGEEWNDLVSGYAILPEDQLREVLARGAHTPEKVVYGKNLHISQCNNHDIFARTGGYDIDGLPFSLIQLARSRIDHKIAMDFKIDYSRDIISIIYRKHKNNIEKIHEIFSEHRFLITQRFFNFSEFKFLANEMGFDGKEVDCVKDFCEKDRSYSIHRSWVLFESLMIELPLDILIELLGLCVRMFVGFYDIYEGGGSQLIKAIRSGERKGSIDFYLDGYRIDHRESVIASGKEYAEFFRDEFGVHLEEDEECHEYDDNILDRIKSYKPPSLTKKDILIYHPEEDPFAFAGRNKEIGDGGGSDDVGISIVSHIDRFVQNLLSQRPSEKLSVKEVASDVRDKFKISSADMGQTKLENIVGAGIPDSRKKGVKGGEV